MKLRNIIWFAAGASISYRLVKNRHTIQKEVSETGQLIEGVQANLAKIQQNLALIQEQKQQLQSLANDFQYKTKVFTQQANASLKEIQDIWSQHQQN